MKPTLLTLLFVLCTFVSAEADKKVPKATKVEQNLDRIQQLLQTQVIDTDPLEKEMSFAKFLAALESQLPKDAKVSLRIDGEAFAKLLPKVAGTTISNFPGGAKLRLGTVLLKVLSRLNDQLPIENGEVATANAIRENAVVITRPRLAAYTATYPVRDVIAQMPRLLPHWKKADAELYEDLNPRDGVGLLVRLLANSVVMEPWETIQVRNGVHLTVLALPHRHPEIDSLLAALRSQADAAVVMNARLYQMDQATYTKHVAPLFVQDKETKQRPRIVRIDGPLLKTLTRQTLLLESENEKILPRQETGFLSRQSAFRYDGGFGPENLFKRTKTGMAGVSFRVWPLVSADRRFLRLRITQDIRQLVGIDKTTKLDIFTGKKEPIESANLRKTSVQGTVLDRVGLALSGAAGV